MKKKLLTSAAIVSFSKNTIRMKETSIFVIFYNLSKYL